jgi:hypothetical protein
VIVGKHLSQGSDIIFPNECSCKSPANLLSAHFYIPYNLFSTYSNMTRYVVDLSPLTPQQWLRLKLVRTINILSAIAKHRFARIGLMTRNSKGVKTKTRVRRRALTFPLPPITPSEIRSSNYWRSVLSALLSVVRIAQPSPKSMKQTPQKALDQSQSLFKLPIEIRQMIWREVLQLGTIHITHLEGHRLGHTRCTDPPDEKWGRSLHDCWGRGCRYSADEMIPSVYHGPIYGFEEPVNLLGLVRSCRAMYETCVHYHSMS